MSMLSLILVGLLLAFCKGVSRSNIFKTKKGKLLLIREGVYHELPSDDGFTLNALGFKKSNARLVADEFLELMKKGEVLPSLKPENLWPDELMRVKIDKIAILDPASYWVESYHIPGHTKEVGAFNPSILRLKDKEDQVVILMCWRSSTKNSVLEFGWYYMGNNTFVRDERIKVDSVTLSGRLSPMEDGRLIELSDDRIVTIFAGHNGGEGNAVQLLSIGYHNKTAGYVDFQRPNHTTQWLKYPEIQKNWVPFVYKEKLLFFQSMNPVHVVRVASRARGEAGDNNFAVVETFSKVRKVTNLPWNGTEYGSHIRGGTPAIMLRGVLFAFFHTQIAFINSWATYFMGAITYCPHPPFHIHSISPVPILKKPLYDGAWANDKYTNYVLFPMGIIKAEDDDHVYVSIGHQDKDAWIVKFHIDGLFNNMKIVHNCSAVPAS